MSAIQQIVVFPRGQLSPKDKERLTKGGVCAIEADDPKAVVVIAPAATTISGDALLYSAMAAIHAARYGETRSDFARELATRLLAQEKRESEHREAAP